MTRVIINYPLDKTGVNPSNLNMNEHVNLIRVRKDIRICKLEHGGFYKENLKVYNVNYEQLVHGVDFVLGYYHKKVSDLFGLKIYSVIVVLKDSISNELFVTSQVVGGDSAYSFTAIDDYTNWVLNQPADYVPKDDDYLGFETVYEPGTLEKLRWKLDTYQPFNNEIDRLTRAVTGLITNGEDEIRKYTRERYDDFVDSFVDIMKPHVEDINNPHDDVKSDIGLDLLENLPLASNAESIAGTINNKYLTPARTWQAFNDVYLKQLKPHIDDKTDPHNVTREQLKAFSKTEIDDLIKVKYFKEEVVSNSRTGYFNDPLGSPASNAVLDKNYATILKEFRHSIPAPNFTTGLVSPNRMAAGTPDQNTVILAGSPRWTNWVDILNNIGTSIGNIVSANFDSSYSRDSAHNFIASNAAYRNLPNDSLVFYRIYARYYTFRSNATSNVYSYFQYASFKNNRGQWIAI